MTSHRTCDVWELSRRQSSVEGELALADAPRLAGQLADVDGALRYRMSGMVDGLGRPAARLRVQGRMRARCGRCGGLVEVPRDEEAQFFFAADEEELGRLPIDESPEEPLLGSHRFDVAGLVEDQAILALPLTPPRRLRRKAKDLYAYICDIPEELPEKILRVAEIAEKRGIRVRPINKQKFDSEMKIFMEVYNSAWNKNWGFIPLTEEETNHISKKLRSIDLPELTLIAEKDKKPVGFMGMLPDFNFVLKKMKGKLNPITIMKAAYYSKRYQT